MEIKINDRITVNTETNVKISNVSSTTFPTVGGVTTTNTNIKYR